jgi:hypothetical protein
MTDNSYHFTRFGIVGPNGNVWSRNTFETVDEAEHYLANFWRDDVQRGKFSVEMINVTLSRIYS